MYLRTTTRANGDGTEVAYLQLAESVWNPAKRRSEVKIVHSFGRVDQANLEELRKLADSINRACNRKSSATEPSSAEARLAKTSLPEGLELLPAKHYGAFYVIEALWKRLGLERILTALLPKPKGRRQSSPHVAALLGMIANRLHAPSSKLACYEAWLRDEVYFPAGAELKLPQLYFAMDFLYEHAEQVEKETFFSVADLFSLDVDLIFFDATTVYFEIEDDTVESSPEAEEDAEPRAKGAPAVEGARRKRGKNKEGRDNSPQVVVALAVTREGLPVRSWIFPGNTVDVTTIKTVREDLKSWKLSRILFVGDAGCYSAANLKTLSSGGGRYLLATPLRTLKELHEEVLSRPGRYKQLNEKLEVKEVVVGEGEARRRYFLCRNQREAERARRHRVLLLRLLRAKLAELEPQEKSDHSKKVCTLLTSKRFGRYLSKEKSGRVFLDPDKVKQDARFDGKWVVTTNDDTLSPEDGALGYKAELIIEACFRRMKTTGIRIRPVYHWLSRRIVAHVKLCVIALLLQRVAEIACDDTWRNLRLALRSIQVIVCQTASGSFVKTTTPTAEALAVLKKLKIQPPARLLAVLPRSVAQADPASPPSDPT